jgi:hypothetical protein
MIEPAATPRAVLAGLAVFGVAVVGLAGCGSPAPAGPTSEAAPPTSSDAPQAAPVSPLLGADWAKVTTFHCPLDDQRVLVANVEYGDLTGDGVADAVVSLTCSTTTSSNPLRIEAFDGTSAPDHPKSLGVLVSESDPIYVEEADVTIASPSVTVAARALGPDAAMAAGPQVKFTQTFTYRDGALHPGPRQTG